MDIAEGLFQTRHHGIRLLHTRKVPFKMGDKQYLLGIAEDITERRQAEKDLKKAHAELEERVRQRTKALIEEIEARKESERALLDSEEKYRAIFEQAPVGIAHIGLDGKWSKTNQKFAQIVGYSPEELVLLSYVDLTHPDDLPQSLELDKQVIEDNTVSISFEKRYIRKDGEYVWVNVTRSAIRSQSGITLYYLSIIEDISHRKQSEAALRELTRHLQTAREDERACIAREIHDELGGVLAAVKFDLSTPVRQNDLDQSGIARRNQETIKLVDHAIIALRRIMAALRPSVLDDLGLWAALEWQAAEFKSRMKIETAFSLKGAEKEVEPNRATALFRMVQEALNNVAKHAQATEVSVTATTSDDNIIITIRDNGCGIKKEEKSKAKSFGILGMQERAQAFGGIIKITGRPGEGTTVSIKFPVTNKPC
jgi:two-component system, NarL family, sensor histidine kinase UhpB